MPFTFNPLSTFPRTGELVLLCDGENFFPAFWNEKLNSRYPLHFLDDLQDSFSAQDGFPDCIATNGFRDPLIDKNNSSYSWLPWPTPENYPKQTP